MRTALALLLLLTPACHTPVATKWEIPSCSSSHPLLSCSGVPSNCVLVAVLLFRTLALICAYDCICKCFSHNCKLMSWISTLHLAPSPGAPKRALTSTSSGVKGASSWVSGFQLMRRRNRSCNNSHGTHEHNQCHSDVGSSSKTGDSLTHFGPSTHGFQGST